MATDDHSLRVASVEDGGKITRRQLGGVLATEFGGDAEFTTAVILISTLASLLTLSLLLTLVM